MHSQKAQSHESLHLNPKKLLRSKWTAAFPKNKEKHFMVVKLIVPALPLTQIECVELEAIHSKHNFVLPWRELNDKNCWIQGLQ